MFLRKSGWLLAVVVAGLALTWLILNGGVRPALAGEYPVYHNPYIEIQRGGLPLIIAVPHGGDLSPEEIPDRQEAVLVNDHASQAAGRELARSLENITGRRPTLIINHIDRRKFDPNRSLAQGAQGNPVAESAWRSFHGAIDLASASISQRCSRGLFIDLHSYGGEEGVLQIGYGLSSSALEQEDESLSGLRFVYETNIRGLALGVDSSLAELIRGPSSLGGRLESAGYPTVPSPAYPNAFNGYFDGGYSVFYHGSRRRGVVDALQLEIPILWLKPERQSDFVEVLAGEIVGYMEDYYQLRADPLSSRACPTFTDVSEDHWASRAIEDQFEQGKVDPCLDSPRKFCPASEIARGEAVRWLWSSLPVEAELDEDGLAVFADVGLDASATQTLWRLGIVDACLIEPLRFCPDRPLTRAQLASWLLRARFGAGIVPSAPSGDFEDIAKQDWQGWWVEQAYHEGLLRPCSSGQSKRLCPQQAVTRAEWAWAINQAFTVQKPENNPTGRAQQP